MKRKTSNPFLKKNVKTQQHTLDSPENTKKQNKYYDTFDLSTFREKPISDEWKEKLAHELIEWADKDEDALRITDFIDAKRLALDDFYRWAVDFKPLKEAHAFALRRLSSRREKGALKRIYDATSVWKMQAHYDKDARALEEWRSALAKQEQADSGIKVVVLEKFPDSGIKPVKKDSDDK